MSVNVLYCGDSHMRDGLLISVLSLLQHTCDALHVYVFTASLRGGGKKFQPLSERDTEPINALLHKKRPDNFLHCYDLTSRFLSEEPTINMSTRFTPYCMLRLWADELSFIPSRLLYLDTDIICRRGFDDFYKQNMDGVELAGVLDYYGSWFFKEHKTEFGREYLNSGMLLLNMAEIRRTGLFKKARSMCRVRRMFLPDQSALNHLVREKRIVPRKYNEQHALQPDTVFQHFTTSFRFFPWVHTVTIKPWQVGQVHAVLGLHEYDDTLERYKILRHQMWGEGDTEATGVQARIIVSKPAIPTHFAPATVRDSRGGEDAARFARAFKIRTLGKDGSTRREEPSPIARWSPGRQEEMNERTVPIFFVSDEEYVPYLSVALCSLVAHTTHSRRYLIYVLSKGITGASRRRLSTISAGYPNVKITFVEMGPKIVKALQEDRNRLRADYVTVTIYFRLFIARLFPQFDRALYVDADTCFLADIADLFDTSLEGKAVGAVNDGFVAGDPTLREYCVRMLGVDPHRYVNSGVLLMDLDQLRRLHFADRFVELLNRYHVRSIAADQDYINVMLSRRILLLDPRWDVMTGAGRRVPGARLIHYNLFSKPWHYPNGLYASEFWRAAASSPFLAELQRRREGFDAAAAHSDEEKKARLVADARDFSHLAVTFRSLMERGVQVRL